MQIWQRHRRGEPTLYKTLPRFMSREEREAELDRIATLFPGHAFWLK